MPEIVADNISIVESSELEGSTRLEAEYYRPSYLSLMDSLRDASNVQLGNIAFVTDGIHASIDYDDKSKIRCLSAQSVKNNYFDLSANTFISGKQHKINLRTSLKSGDVILSSVGTIGNCAVVTEDILPANADRHVAIIRLLTSGLSPFYLSVFLNSKYGGFQTLREATGNVQLNLFIDKIKRLVIPQLKIQREIGELAQKAHRLLLSANSFYSQAESLLLNELGIKDIDLSHEPCYEVSSGNVLSANRIDAEYYQPKYERIIEAIKKYPYKFIGDMFRLVKGIEPGSSVYRDEGKPFIRVSNLSKFEINDNNQQYLSEETYSTLKTSYQPLNGELLLSKDATPGIAFHVKEPIEGIISGGILRLQATFNVKREYICLVINSIVGQSQIERDSGGSVINHWKPTQVKNTLIPLLPDKIQEKIESLCLESHSARRQAKQLLEEAKRKVENMIEKSAGES